MALTTLLQNKLLAWNIQGDVGPFTCYTSTRKKIVYFLRAPPLTPASPAQRVLRDRFVEAANAWQLLSNEQREQWQTTCDRASLVCTGYNLFTWFFLKQRSWNLACYAGRAGTTIP